MSFHRHICNYEDVDLRVEAGEWVARDASDMSAEDTSGDGSPLPGASVWAIYRKAVSP